MCQAEREQTFADSAVDVYSFLALALGFGEARATRPSEVSYASMLAEWLTYVMLESRILDSNRGHAY